MTENEYITCAIFNPNGINFAIGTNLGNVFVGALKEETNGNPKILVGKLDNITKSTSNGVTSL